ncbi:TPM domain-containing protein [Saprospira grandis]|uniref:TPM domain-containing protein n=1 Tax=Saprospira grandis TaxID=1008 RepID=UPI0022DD469E|nr:TPM domain-containing protein [Saprospira grandis]WBM75293.1 TPM domain-containing protein [Saprospira grandis]
MKNILLFCTLFFALHLGAQVPNQRPDAQQYVYDYADLLAQKERNALQHYLERVAAAQEVDPLIVLVKHLGSSTVEAYAYTLATNWGLGKEKANALLILVSRAEHQLRIEVGSNLAEPLSYEVCKKVIADKLSPAFKKEEYYFGLLESMQELLKKGGFQAPDPEKIGLSTRKSREANLIWRILFYLLLIVAALFAFFTLYGWGAGKASAVNHHDYSRKGKQDNYRYRRRRRWYKDHSDYSDYSDSDRFDYSDYSDSDSSSDNSFSGGGASGSW